MTRRQRTNGIIAGAICVTGCTAIVFTECFYRGQWYWCIPIAGLYMWGFLSFLELDGENDRREAALRSHGIPD